MRKKHSIQIGGKYGKYTALQVVMHRTCSGKIEKRYECVDQQGLVRYIRARILTSLVSQDIVEKQFQEELNQLVANNRHQMGIRNRYFSEYWRNA